MRYLRIFKQRPQGRNELGRDVVNCILRILLCGARVSATSGVVRNVSVPLNTPIRCFQIATLIGTIAVISCVGLTNSVAAQQADPPGLGLAFQGVEELLDQTASPELEDTPHVEEPYEDTSYVEEPYEDTSYVEEPYEDTSYVEEPYEDTSYVEEPYEDTSYVEEPYEDTSYVEEPYEDTSYAEQLTEEQLAENQFPEYQPSEDQFLADQVTGDPFVGQEVAAVKPIRVFLDDQLLSEAFGEQDNNVPDSGGATISTALLSLKVEQEFVGQDREANLTITPPDEYFDASDPSARAISFSTTWNYGAFVERAELRFYAASANPRSKPLSVLPVENGGVAQWSDPFGRGEAKQPASQVALRLYDNKGNYDQLALANIYPSEGADNNGYGFNGDPFWVRNIEVYGAAIAVKGEGLGEDAVVRVNGQQVQTEWGQFTSIQLLPPGQHDVEVTVSGGDGSQIALLRRAFIPKSDLFITALGDLTVTGKVGKDFEDHLTPLTGEASNEELAVSAEGRGALFAKGRIAGKFLLTVALDTDEGQLSNRLSNLIAQDPTSILTRIDPNETYTVYGDSSQSADAAPTAQKLFVKLERDGNHVLWGNFDARLTDIEFARIDRSFYGAEAKFVKRLQGDTADVKIDVTAFATPPGELTQSDQIQGNGGFVYRLEQQDLSAGTEQVRIVVRNQVTGVVEDEQPLYRGQDYSIDYIDGTVVLNRPLSAYRDNDSLFGDEDSVFSGDPVFLVVRYSYLPTDSDLTSYIYGGRTEVDISEKVAFGTTALVDSTGEANQTLLSVDAKAAIRQNGWVKAQYTRTVSNGLGELLSNGGVDPGTTLVQADGWKAQAYLRLDDFGLTNEPSVLNAYYQDKQAGFAAPNEASSSDESSYGIEAKLPFADGRITVRGRIQGRQDRTNQQSSREISLDVGGAITERLRGGIGIKNLADSVQGARTDVGGRLEYDVTPRLNLGLFGQSSIQADPESIARNRGGLRGSYAVTDNFTLGGEVTAGTGGVGVKLGAIRTGESGDRAFIQYETSSEPGENFQLLEQTPGRKGLLTVGGDLKVSERLSLNGEVGVKHAADSLQSYTQRIGAQVAITDRLSLAANTEVETAINFETDALFVARTSTDGRLSYYGDGLSGEAGVAYRTEVDFADEKTQTVETSASLKFTLNPNWTLASRLNALIARSDFGTYDAAFMEGSLGFAYRPVANNKLVALFNATAYYDLHGLIGQQANVRSDFRQRNHIFTGDVSYDLTPNLAVGGKYALKWGQSTSGRQSNDWRATTVHGAALRADYKFAENWSGLIEGRLVHSAEGNSTRFGAMAAIYRHFSNKLKIGVGTNLTSVSDDLTNVNAKADRFFINVIAVH